MPHPSIKHTRADLDDFKEHKIPGEPSVFNDTQGYLEIPEQYQVTPPTAAQKYLKDTLA